MGHWNTFIYLSISLFIPRLKTNIPCKKKIMYKAHLTHEQSSPWWKINTFKRFFFRRKNIYNMAQNGNNQPRWKRQEAFLALGIVRLISWKGVESLSQPCWQQKIEGISSPHPGLCRFAFYKGVQRNLWQKDSALILVLFRRCRQTEKMQTILFAALYKTVWLAWPLRDSVIAEVCL